MQAEREAIVEYGKRLIAEDLTVGTGGNLSIYNPELKYFAISPSGIDYYETKPEDVVVMDLNEQIIVGNRKPSSEFHMHRLIYQEKPEARAIVHCHSSFATALAMTRQDLPAASYLIAEAGGNDIKCSRYENYGTMELAQAVLEVLEDRKACLIANHGQLSYGDSLESAFSLAKSVEWMCKCYLFSKLAGEAKIISPDKIKEILESFKSYGQDKN